MLRAALLASATMLCASIVGAREPEAASLGWVRLPGAESCPSAQALARTIEARIGRAVFVSPSQAELFIEARVERTRTGLAAHMQATRADGRRLGSRELSSAKTDCSELADELVLVIALTIDPDAELRPKDAPEPAPLPPPPRAECPSPAPAPRLEVKRVPLPVPVPGASEPRRWTGEARLGISATVGLLPGITPGLVAAGSVWIPGFVPVELSGSAWPEREVDVSGGGARFTLLTAELALCPASALGGLQAHFCGGIAAGSMRARAFGFDQSGEQAQALVMVTAKLRMSLPLGRLPFVSAGIGLESPVVRPRFYYTEASGSERDLHRVPPVGGSAEVGFGFHFSS